MKEKEAVVRTWRCDSCGTERASVDKHLKRCQCGGWFTCRRRQPVRGDKYSIRMLKSLFGE